MAVTPNGVDVYSRYMEERFDLKDVIGVSTVWQQFFGKPAFSNSKTLYRPNSEVIDIDIMGANERTAKLIKRGTDSRHTAGIQDNTTTQYFSTVSRVFPLAEEMGDITASQLNKRVAGENPYEGKNKFQRCREIALEHHKEHIRRYVRLFELLAGSSLLTGQQPAILGTTNADLTYDWLRNASLSVTPAIAWDQAGSDIMGDIDDWFDLLRQIGKVKPNVAFLGSNVASAIFENTTLAALADNRGFQLIRNLGTNTSVPSGMSDLVEGGADYRGFLVTPKGRRLDLFCYNDYYDDDNGVSQPYMPANTFFLAKYGARCDRYFGPSEKLQTLSIDNVLYSEMFGMKPTALPPIKIMGSGIITPQMFYCDAYRANDNKKVTIRTQSAPIFATTQTNAFLTASSVTGGEVS